MAQDDDAKATSSSATSSPFGRTGTSSSSNVIPCVVGAGTIGVRDAMIAAVGDEVVSRALSKLPEEQQQQYAAITASMWVPLELSSQVIELVAIEAGRGVEQFFSEMVRAGTMRSLNAFYRTLLRFAWDEMLVARAAGSYARIRNVGRLEASLVRPGEAIAELREWPDLSERHARSLGYTMEAFFLAAGKTEVRVDTSLHEPLPGKGPDGATYRCYWRS
jgi:hypothetical protein